MLLDCEVYSVVKLNEDWIQLFNKDKILLFEGKPCKSVAVVNESNLKAVVCLKEVCVGYVLIN